LSRCQQGSQVVASEWRRFSETGLLRFLSTDQQYTTHAILGSDRRLARLAAGLSDYSSCTPLFVMSLVQDVTFDSLGAVRQELREWLGPDAVVPLRSEKNNVARDVLISVLIHNLAEELSDVRTRSQIQALLAHMTQTAAGRPAAD
jgi:hypothetical protein